jgi:hypothetical protein
MREYVELLADAQPYGDEHEEAGIKNASSGRECRKECRSTNDKSPTHLMTTGPPRPAIRYNVLLSSRS